MEALGQARGPPSTVNNGESTVRGADAPEARGSDGPSAPHDVQNHQDDGDHQDDVNRSGGDVEGEEAEQPQNHKYASNDREHDFCLS